MRRFVFFHGYQEEHPLLDIDWEAINRLNNLNTIITPNWDGINYNPRWIVYPGLFQYTPPNYTITTTPNYTTTTTPNPFGTGYITIPFEGTASTGTGFSLTTSNTTGTTDTTTGVIGTLTTGTALYSSSSFKLY